MRVKEKQEASWILPLLAKARVPFVFPSSLPLSHSDFPLVGSTEERKVRPGAAFLPPGSLLLVEAWLGPQPHPDSCPDSTLTGAMEFLFMFKPDLHKHIYMHSHRSFEMKSRWFPHSRYEGERRKSMLLTSIGSPPFRNLIKAHDAITHQKNTQTHTRLCLQL